MCDSIIISIDDNKVYDKYLIENMINIHNDYPNHTLIDSKNGIMLFKPDHFNCDVLDRDGPVCDNMTTILKNVNHIKKIDNLYNYPTCTHMIIS